MKIILMILTALFLILAAATYFIGSYFVDYALVPNNGAEERKIEEPQGASKEEDRKPTKTLIGRTQAADEAKRDEWLQQMDAQAHEVQITAKDGLTLVGHSFKHEKPTDNWVILAHGYQSDENETLLIGRHFYEAGYNILTMGLRSHGKSEGHYIGMGYLDKDDLIAWTNQLVEKYPDSQIIYHGTSMGGATVLMASGMELPDNVKAVVADCAYTSIWDIFSSEMKKRFNLQPFPVLHMARIMGIFKAGYDIKKGNVVEFVEKGTLPTFFIHSKPDDFVPVQMVYELHEAKGTGEKELYIFDKGGHAQAKFVNSPLYYEKIFTFIQQYL